MTEQIFLSSLTNQEIIFALGWFQRREMFGCFVKSGVTHWEDVVTGDTKNY